MGCFQLCRGWNEFGRWWGKITARCFATEMYPFTSAGVSLISGQSKLISNGLWWLFSVSNLLETVLFSEELFVIYTSTEGVWRRQTKSISDQQKSDGFCWCGGASKHLLMTDGEDHTELMRERSRRDSCVLWKKKRKRVKGRCRSDVLLAKKPQYEQTRTVRRWKINKCSFAFTYAGVEAPYSAGVSRSEHI